MSKSAVPLQRRCMAIELLIVDVDGVLTPGGIIYADSGAEVKRFHVRDGSGLKLWQQAGKQVAIITGRSSPIVDRRARELGIDSVVQGAADKLQAFREVANRNGRHPEQICYIGDDLPDLPALRACGLAVAVADACADVLSEAHYVARATGGNGAVREVIEVILRCQDRWQPIVERFSAARLPDH